MIIGRLRIQYKRENINFRIKISSIFLVNQIYELEPCLAISLEKAPQSGLEFSLRDRQFNMTAQKGLAMPPNVGLRTVSVVRWFHLRQPTPTLPYVDRTVKAAGESCSSDTMIYLFECRLCGFLCWSLNQNIENESRRISPGIL